MAFCSKCGRELPADATFCPSCGTPVQPSTSTAAPTATPTQSPPLSGLDALTKDQKAQEYWVRRLIAFVVDAVIVLVILAIITAVAAIPFLFFNGFAPYAWFFGAFSALWGLILVFYFAISESTSGASIGKRVFNLKVVSRTGSAPTFAEVFIRNLSKIYWLLLLLDVIVGLAVSKNYQQKCSDQFAGTTVVSK